MSFACRSYIQIRTGLTINFFYLLQQWQVSTEEAQKNQASLLYIPLLYIIILLKLVMIFVIIMLQLVIHLVLLVLYNVLRSWSQHLWIHDQGDPLNRSISSCGLPWRKVGPQLHSSHPTTPCHGTFDNEPSENSKWSSLFISNIESFILTSKHIKLVKVFKSLFSAYSIWQTLESRSLQWLKHRISKRTLV